MAGIKPMSRKNITTRLSRSRLYFQQLVHRWNILTKQMQFDYLMSEASTETQVLIELRI